MMSARLRAEEAVEQMKKSNPYFEKYSKKIAVLQETSPDEFVQRVESVNKAKSPPKQDKPRWVVRWHNWFDGRYRSKRYAYSNNRDYAELLKPKTSIAGKPELPHKQLSDIMKIDLLENKTAEEIKHIWLDYHKDKDVLAAAIPTETYELLMTRAKQYPLFIFPLPRSQGFEFFLLQFASNTVHFTPLLCYQVRLWQFKLRLCEMNWRIVFLLLVWILQVHKENAPECLNMVHYTEFSEKMGVVLMRAEVDTNVINVQEAQCLANQLQLYYAQNTKTKLDLLERFTKSPDSFKHMDVINELQNLSIDSAKKE